MGFLSAIQRGRGIFNLALDKRRLNAALNDFARRNGPAMVDLVARKASADALAMIMQSLNGPAAGFPNPRRIDTGRYRAGWGTARQQLAGGGLKREIRLENAVEYGSHIEFGTAKMAAGHHVAFALVAARKSILGLLGREMPRAWHL